jgi:gluconate 2-dehydrogenase gamma chain
METNASEGNRSLRFQRRTVERRTVLKMMVALPVAGMLPLSALAEMVRGLPDEGRAAPKEDAGEWRLRVLTAHEWATVVVLGDWILPADETSGSASEAGVPEFIDDWLEFQGGNLLEEIRGGLVWLDAASLRYFGKDFLDCPADRQREMLDRIAYPAKVAVVDAAGVAFFNRMRDLVLSGFYTSEMGIRSLPYVGNEPQSEWHGCPPAVMAKLGV